MTDTHVIRMPDLGEGIAEVEIVAWHVAPGDHVTEDQALADVMTDKATVEIPSPVAGTVEALGGEVGEIVAVGAELIRIDTAAPQGEAPRAEQASPTPPPADTRSIPVIETDANLASTTPATSGAATVADQDNAVRLADASAAGNRPLASPAVRRHARGLELDLHHVVGSGPDGRILHDDLEQAMRSSQPQPAMVQAPQEAGTRVTRLTGLRRRIAENMARTLEIPAFSYVEEVDVTELEQLRRQLNDRQTEPPAHLTVLPFILRALVLALREHPALNAHYDGGQGVLTEYTAVHAGIAAHTDNGLVVPVLRDVQDKDIWAMATEITRLATTARQGKLRREELSGSTIGVTSLGALGGVASTPILNAPEVAIVGVNRIIEKPVVHHGAIVIRQTMNLSSSFDHRVVDGMQAARFVQTLRRRLECPALLFVD